jgi:hypothetical protein
MQYLICKDKKGKQDYVYLEEAFISKERDLNANLLTKELILHNWKNVHYLCTIEFPSGKN